MQGQDTVSLNSIEVTTQKNALSQFGKKTETLDSTLKAQFRFNSVADALSFNTPVFIKSYGPGALATTAFRGGNASQTAVLWNGFNIQNAMLGQSDLALMPAILFENVEVEYGGSSSLWGSGAVGGSIHLDNKSPFNAGLITTTNLGGGSFGMLNGSTRILASRQRFVSSTKLYGIRSENNFTYKDSLDKTHPTKQQQNAGYHFEGLMQEFKFLVNSRQILSLDAWINNNFRRLPDVSTLSESKTYQQDKAVRLTTNWNYQALRFKSIAKLGYFNDQINYTDSLAALFSKSKVQTFIAENENYWNWNNKNQLNYGLNFSSSSGTSNNYNGIRSTSRISALAGNRFSLFRNRVGIYASLRADYFSAGKLPVTGSVAGEWHFLKKMTAKLNAARVYRQPSLNELYWVPGGNPNLKPEQGYTLEGELKYSKEVNHFSFFVSGAAYSRWITNWILWVPGANGNPAPVNIQQVWSRGGETTWRLRYRLKNLNLGVGLITGYVLSTIQSNLQENSNTLFKQLVYTPRYTVNGNFSAGYKRLNLVLFSQYIGYRYTTSDDTQWLKPYQVVSLKLNYTASLQTFSVTFFSACNNLFGNSYTIMAGRPMPLRNYEFGITLQTKTNHHKHQ